MFTQATPHETAPGRHQLTEADEGTARDVVQIYSEATRGLVMPVPRRSEPARHERDGEVAR